MKLSVVIPVFNEIDTLSTVIERVREVELPLEKEIILVDDGSTDGSREYLRELDDPDIKAFFQDRNQGKGAALRRGFAEATGDLVIIQDADLEYDPADFPRLLGPILDARADVVYGSRFLGGPHRVLFFWHFAANRFLTLLCNMVSNLNLTDMETCYKAFRRDALDGVKLRANRFGIEPELTIKFSRKGLRIFETPISYSGRTYAEGKKIGWKDAIAAVYFIFRFSLFD